MLSSPQMTPSDPSLLLGPRHLSKSPLWPLGVGCALHRECKDPSSLVSHSGLPWTSRMTLGTVLVF